MQGSGVSSAAIWTPFDSVTTATIRKVKAKVLIAWTRVADVQNFATVGTSLVGGTDILQGVGDQAINNADSFLYFDETDKTIRLEYERHLIEPLGGMSIAICDLVLDNNDLRFTPDYNSTIGTALRPNRPIKLFIGFEVQGQEKLVSIIEGLTLQPKEDKMKRQVTISAYDYLKWLNEKPQETTIYQDQRSDEIIADILSRAGVGSAAYQLDQGINTVGFAWFEKGQTAGDRIRRICEAEEAIFYQDENGVLRFENRDKYSQLNFSTPTWTIESDDILNWQVMNSSKIINRVLIEGKPRTVKGEAEVWRDGVEEEIPASSSLTIWANFNDPVSSLTSPSSGTDYTAFTATGGAGSDITSDVSIAMTTFTKAAKLIITNANVSNTAFVNLLKIRGTPATVDYEITEVMQDDNSVSDYNEQQLTVSNPFIDSKNFAANMAQDLVRRHKDPNSVVKLTIRGVPQLQLRDMIKVKDQDVGTYTNYRLIGIQGIVEAGAFVQNLTLRKISVNEAN